VIGASRRLTGTFGMYVEPTGSRFRRLNRPDTLIGHDALLVLERFGNRKYESEKAGAVVGMIKAGREDGEATAQAETQPTIPPLP